MPQEWGIRGRPQRAVDNLLQDCSVINGRLYTLDVFIFEPQDMGRDGAQVLQLHSDRQYDVVLDLTHGDLLRLWSCYRH